MSLSGDYFDEAVAEAYEDGLKRGAERERAAVVEWLRKRTHEVAASNDIESGKHREEE